MMADSSILNDARFVDHIKDHALHSPLAIMVHGSFADGLAKPGSDIDVLIPTENIIDSQPLPSPYGNIHIEYYSLDELRREIENLDNEYRHRILDFSFLVARLKTSVLLYDPHNYGREIIEALRDYRPSDMTRRKFYIQAIAFREDAISALRDGDWVQALIASRFSAMSLGAGYLLDKGVTNLNIKWQHHFMDRVAAGAEADDQQFFALYTDVLGLNGEGLKRRACQTMHNLIAMMKLYDVPTLKLHLHNEEQGEDKHDC